ncbi:SUMF1/EgtB/PvdO family nonheme iron enzyme [bacterium]|nr:SUMF1/EgtB/PvdO family nonheme iron enzyme [bacterium]
MKNMIFIFATLIFIAFSSFSQDRGVKLKIKDSVGNEISLYDESYALVIGCGKYEVGWPELPNAINDAIKVADILSNQGFNVTLLKNPSFIELNKAVNYFVYHIGLNSNNRILFYYAGHGYTMKMSYGANMGYIVPVDAPLPGIDRSEFLSKAISMQMFETYARQIQSKHVLYIFDSCFSGTIFALSRAIPSSISYKTAKPVRQFITAGDENEEVPDKSVFNSQFIAGINGEADCNKDGYVTGTELGDFLQNTVVNYTRESQHPQYGKIRDPNLDKGDFVFVFESGDLLNKNKKSVKEGLQSINDPLAMNFSKYTNEKDKYEWIKKLELMKSDFNKAKEINKDENISVINKKRMWNDFLNIYNEDNPYAELDDQMRQIALNMINTLEDTSSVFIAGGAFVMGSEKGKSNEKPVRNIKISSFHIDRVEVSVGQYQAFCLATNREMPKQPDWSSESCPVVNVQYEDACDYAKWKGKRLPTEAEWEYAAKGGIENIIYPWGNETSNKKANFNGSDGWDKTAPVYSFATNNYGIYCMAGNVAEWCSDWYSPWGYLENDLKDPQGTKTGDLRVIRGGSYKSKIDDLRCTARQGKDPRFRYDFVGFRCAKSIDMK